VWRACPASESIPGGWCHRHERVPLVRHLNAVCLRRCPSADGVEAVAERWQAGLPHRHVVIEDPEPAERLAAELDARGWARERVVLMAADPAAVHARRDPRAREVDEAALRALEQRVFAEDAPRTRSELPSQLAEAQRLLRAATDVRRFAADDGRMLASMATLYLDPDVGGVRVALVESVATLRAHRERGLGTAVVSATLAAARSWNAALAAVVTDADDWPQVWYAGLGFAPVRRHVAYVRGGSGGTSE
jgi:predicted N-acetyltransferase YhbS